MRCVNQQELSMTTVNQIALAPELTALAAQHIRAVMRESPSIEAAAL
jgi:hypothetical protein